MDTYRLGLFFKEMPKGELPGPPISQVFVKRPLRAEYPGGSRDTVYLTLRAGGQHEIHQAIDKLIAELESLKRKATALYNRAERKEAKAERKLGQKDG